MLLQFVCYSLSLMPPIPLPFPVFLVLFRIQNKWSKWGHGSSIQISQLISRTGKFQQPQIQGGEAGMIRFFQGVVRSGILSERSIWNILALAVLSASPKQFKFSSLPNPSNCGTFCPELIFPDTLSSRSPTHHQEQAFCHEFSMHWSPTSSQPVIQGYQKKSSKKCA